MDQKVKVVHIFELTVPGESRLDIGHKLKAESYEPQYVDLQEDLLGPYGLH